MRTQYVSGDRSGRVAVAFVIYGGNYRPVKIVRMLQRAVKRNGKRLITYPAFAQGVYSLIVIHIRL